MHHVNWSRPESDVSELSSLLGDSFALTEASIESSGDGFDGGANHDFNVRHEGHNEHCLLDLDTNV